MYRTYSSEEDADGKGTTSSTTNASTTGSNGFIGLSRIKIYGLVLFINDGLVGSTTITSAATSSSSSSSSSMKIQK